MKPKVLTLLQLSKYLIIFKLLSIVFVAMMASPNGTRYLDMFGGENFHSWKLWMSFLLKREGYWKLVVGEGPKPILHTPIERNIQERISGEGVNECTSTNTNGGTSSGINDAFAINRVLIAI